MAQSPKLLLVDPDAVSLPDAALAFTSAGFDVMVLTRDGAAPAGAPYRVLRGRLVGLGRRVVFLNGLAEALFSQPDIVHVRWEPDTALALQTFSFARRIAPRALRVGHSEGGRLSRLASPVYALMHGLTSTYGGAAPGYDGPVEIIPPAEFGVRSSEFFERLLEERGGRHG